MKAEDVDALLAPVRAALLGEAAPINTRPRLTATDLAPLRYFRLPDVDSNGQSFSYGGGPVALRPGGVFGPTLFVGNRYGFVAEVTIPLRPGVFADYVQPFTEPTEGKRSQATANEAYLGGLLVVGDTLLGTVYEYYDASNRQRCSHFTRPCDLSQTGHVSDLVSVWDAEKTGYVAGYLAPVPSEWQAALKGSILTGQFGIPIVGRTSFGPAAFAINWPLVSPVTPATPLVYYPEAHATLGAWSGSNPAYGGTASCGGLVVIAGTRTALFLGRNGLGPYSYGEGGAPLDPANSDKGPHAFPYRYQAWAYDLNDFADVAVGNKPPWAILPYDVWPLSFSTLEPGFAGIGGAAYDPDTKRLYLSQLRADTDGYAKRAYIHVWQVTI